MHPRLIRVQDPTTGGTLSMPAEKRTVCGQMAMLDIDACYPAYRCMTCNAIEGSVGMPRHCAELLEAVKLRDSDRPDG